MRGLVTSPGEKDWRSTMQTWLEVAIQRGAKADKHGAYTAGELAKVNVQLLNGCVVCHATVGAHNSYKVGPQNDYAYCKSCAGLDA